ncbi:MAG: signal peptidase I [Candidatus Altimarinota bacterium]
MNMTNFYLISHLLYLIFFISPFQVEGDSMLPYMHPGELFLIDQRDLVKANPARADVIVFSFGDEYYYVKRVIGLPGESVKLQENNVYIKDGSGKYQLLKENYLLGKSFNYGDERIFKIPAGHYFVMGDNRNNSKDSRFFEDPYISSEQIYGKMVFPE